MSNQKSRPTSVTPVHILLVGHNRNGLAARKTVLSEQGYIVTTATCGTQAWELFLEGSYGLVITDCTTAEMRGVDLIARIRDERPAVPIILISAYVDSLGLNEANTRADAVIQKSANEVSHLVLAVNRLLRRKAPRKPSSRQSASTSRVKIATGA
jgi:two-component system response regulator HydG